MKQLAEGKDESGTPFILPLGALMLHAGDALVSFLVLKNMVSSADR